MQCKRVISLQGKKKQTQFKDGKRSKIYLTEDERSYRKKCPSP